MRSAAVLTVLGLCLSGLRADEGMWTFDNLPVKKMKEKYGFAPDQAWLDKVRLATVRFPGGTGSFISRDGLVLTNHHVGHATIQRLGDKDHDYVENGFVARTRDQEIKAPGLVLFSLVSMENVTAKVEKSVAAGMGEAQAAAAKDKALAALVQEEAGRTGLVCESVRLYQGGELWIYRYKKFDDVRFVMAPEYSASNFGKDWDNFTWPRHDVDMSIWRVYENGKPYRPTHYLPWSRKGVKLGDMTFVVGHPGRTSRLDTVAQMGLTRDVLSPLQARSLDRRRGLLHAWVAADARRAAQVSSQLMGAENFYKVYDGEARGLRDPDAFARLEAAEKDLRAKVAADPKLQALAGGSWAAIEEATARHRAVAKEELLLASRTSPLVGGFLGGATQLVRAIEEAGKPAGDARRPGGGRRPGDAFAPEGRELNRELLVSAYAEAQTELGDAHPLVKTLLGGRRPEEAARAALEGTTLLDPAARKALQEGGAAALGASRDPLVLAARAILAFERDTQKELQAIRAITGEHGTRIAKARFAVYGKDTYPDATFTLRLSFGAVATYPGAGTLQQPFTTFAGLYDRAAAWGPTAENGSWALPQRWWDRRTAIDLLTPYNFLSTNDIIGGNSGSPVVDRDGELVGLAFDGNMESHVGRFLFDERVNRCLSVDARGMIEMLTKVYEAKNLVDEIQGR